MTHNEGDNNNRDASVTIEEAKEVVIEQSRSGSLSTPGAIVLGSFLIAGAIFFGLINMGDGISFPGVDVGDTDEVTLLEEDADTPTLAGEITSGDLPVLGDPDAPVLVVEWSDYQCPFCARFFSQTESEIIKQYVDTGKVRFAYRDFAFLGQESGYAANAARCANEQGKFWEFHDFLFNSQGGENRGAFSKEILKGFGAELGLDTAKFNSCVDSDKYADAVSADTAAGREAGVSGTPTTFINGQVVNGAQPFSAFKAIIDEKLEKAGE